MSLTTPDSLAPQTACSDTAFTFVLNESAGGCGNQIEWALNSSFATSTVIASPGIISATVTVGATDTLWVRSRDSVSGSVSSAVYTILKVNVKPSPITPPAPQAYCSDTAISFTFDSIIVGTYGNEVQWSLTNMFLAPHIAISPANISLMVGAGANMTIWLRSMDR